MKEHEDSNNEDDGNKIVSGSPKTNDRLLKEKSVSVIIIKFKHSSADINRFVAENTVSRTVRTKLDSTNTIRCLFEQTETISCHKPKEIVRARHCASFFGVYSWGKNRKQGHGYTTPYLNSGEKKDKNAF